MCERESRVNPFRNTFFVFSRFSENFDAAFDLFFLCSIAIDSSCLPFSFISTFEVTSWEKQVRRGTSGSWRGRSWKDREGGEEEEEEESPHMTAVACLLVLGKDTGISQQTTSLSFYLSASPSLSLSSSLFSFMCPYLSCPYLSLVFCLFISINFFYCWKFQLLCVSAQRWVASLLPNGTLFLDNTCA